MLKKLIGCFICLFLMAGIAGAERADDCGCEPEAAKVHTAKKYTNCSDTVKIDNCERTYRPYVKCSDRNKRTDCRRNDDCCKRVGTYDPCRKYDRCKKVRRYDPWKYDQCKKERKHDPCRKYDRRKKDCKYDPCRKYRSTRCSSPCFGGYTGSYAHAAYYDYAAIEKVSAYSEADKSTSFGLMNYPAFSVNKNALWTFIV